MDAPSGTPVKQSRRYADDDDDDEDEEQYVPKENYAAAKNRPVATAARGGATRKSYDDDDDEDEGAGEGDEEEENRWEGAHVRRGSAEVNKLKAREREEAILRAMDMGKQAAAVPQPLNLANMREFLTTPVPKSAGTVLCYIRRDKSGIHRLHPVYSLWLKEGDRFLLQSKKRSNNKTSNYIISMGSSPADLDKVSSTYLGKLRSNFMGTEFQVSDPHRTLT
jgi:tubby-related protein 1